MFLHLDEWPWLLNIYKARLLQICYVTCFCNVYAWIKSISCILTFLWFLHRYCTKALSTPLPCLMIIVLLKSAIRFFFVLTSGRPLPVTTFYLFEATLQPLSSPDRDSGIFCTAATALFIAPSCNIHSYIPHFSWSLFLWFTYCTVIFREL